jgi:hypothetical protein
VLISFERVFDLAASWRSEKGHKGIKGRMGRWAFALSKGRIHYNGTQGWNFQKSEQSAPTSERKGADNQTIEDLKDPVGF